MATKKKTATKKTAANGEGQKVRAATLSDLVAQKPRQLDVKGLLADGTACRLYIRQLTAKEMIAFNERPADQKDNTSALAWLISKAVVDADGVPMLTEQGAGDLTTRPFMQIVPVVLELNPITTAEAGGAEGNA